MKTQFVSFFFFFAVAFVFAQNNNYITSKYDFIPGEKVIFYDDFSGENIGDFPVNWNTNGSGEIVSLSNYEGRWLQLTKQGYFIPEINEEFTENFTIEFDCIPMNTIGEEHMWGVDFYLLSTERNNPKGGSQPGNAGFRMYPDYETVFWNNWSEAREWMGDEGSTSFKFDASQKYHFAFWIQKQRIRVYVNENKVLDLPKGLQSGYTYNVFRIEPSSDEVSPLISNFRIATGLPDLRSKLLTDGKLISYGILFDVNSDKLKPESFGTIKMIADILKENPNLRVSIIGHTDSDGDDASNLDLSKRRALAVKNELITSFGIDASRLETDGKGESDPLVPNSSSVNKAQNRRVEFIKL